MERSIILVTVTRYAELNKIDRTTVQRWVKDGKLTKYFTPKSKSYFLNPIEKPSE